MSGKKCYCDRESALAEFVLNSLSNGNIPYYVDICYSRDISFKDPKEADKVEKMIFQYSFLITSEDCQRVFVCSRNEESHRNSRGKSVLFSCALSKDKIPRHNEDILSILKDGVIELSNVKSCDFFSIMKRTVERGENGSFGLCEYVSYVYHVRVDLDGLMTKYPNEINDKLVKDRYDIVDILEVKKAVNDIKDDYIGLISLSKIANLEVPDDVMKSVVFLPAEKNVDPVIKNPPEVFICHANKTEDNEYVKKLVAVFKEMGIAYWVDIEHLEDSSCWRSQAIQMLRSSKYVLIICTENMIKPGEGVIRELEELENKRKTLGDCSVYKIFFGEYNNENMLGGRFKDATGSAVIDDSNSLQVVIKDWAKKNNLKKLCEC